MSKTCTSCGAPVSILGWYEESAENTRLREELAEARRALTAFVAWDRAEGGPLEKFDCQARVALYAWARYLASKVIEQNSEPFEPPRHAIRVDGSFAETGVDECKRLVVSAMTEGGEGDG